MRLSIKGLSIDLFSLHPCQLLFHSYPQLSSAIFVGEWFYGITKRRQDALEGVPQEPG